MKKTDLSKFSNKATYQHPSMLYRLLWMLCSRLFLETRLPLLVSFKVLVLRAFGAKIGKGVVLKPSLKIKYPKYLSVGDHSWIGETVWIDNFVPVAIGANVCVSQNAYLLTGNHNYKKTTFDLITGSIVLEYGVWIGAKTIVCPGVTCKSHAVLSVGSVASTNLEAYSIYRGNPAVFLKKRDITE
jgi:putative colanic acid biosynthesis acetyltransferase WcaF